MKKIKSIIFKKGLEQIENLNLLSFFTEKKFDDNVLHSKDINYPKISIIMPSYNQEEFIERSILSVLNQNYPNLEFIIMDGGSTDNSVQIIKKYEKHIDFWISEKDNGQSDALNKGIAKATGDLLGWMNSDDTYLPNALLTVGELYKKEKNEVIFGNTIAINEQDELIDVTYSFPFSYNHMVSEGFVAVTQSIFWTRNLHSKIPGFDVDLFTNMDLDFYLQLGEAYDIKKWTYVNEFFGAFRRQRNQKTSERFREVMLKDLLYVEKKHNIKYLEKNLKKYIYKLKRYYHYLSLSR